MDGPGAIKGNCQKCSDLVAIHDLHQKALRLMRTFRSVEDKKAIKEPADDGQMSLFA